MTHKKRYVGYTKNIVLLWSDYLSLIWRQWFVLSASACISFTYDRKKILRYCFGFHVLQQWF